MTAPVPSSAGAAFAVARCAAPPAAARAKAAAEEFEAVFLGTMLNQMFEGLTGDGPFGDAGGAGPWRSFLADEYGRSIARAGGVGIADHVYRTLLAQQEKAP